MVDFTLTDEQKSLREMAHDFAVKEIRPVAWEYDRDGTWPQDVVEKAWGVGLMNSHIPEEYGGAGAGYLDGCLIEEELSWGCSGIQTSLGCNGLASTPVLIGGYANWYTVFAKTDKDAGHRGISAFVVPRDAGVVVDKKEDKLGQRASNTATISLNDVEIPAENLLGEENKGFKLAMMTLDRTRPGVAAMATGIARAAFEFATDYSRERVQFGVPIAMHQAVQFMIADMATDIEAARLLTWKSPGMVDGGRRNTLISSHAKRFAADTAMKVATEAVEVYGGYGFIKDYPVEKLFRDAKIMQLYEGTSQIQRLVIARETLLPRHVEEPAAVGGVETVAV